MTLVPISPEISPAIPSDEEKRRGEERNHGLTIVSKINHCQTTKTPPTPTILAKEVEKGLDVICSHFMGDIWPRAISTKAREGRQVVVDSKEQALAYFKAANYKDCRISAYPPNATENSSATQRFVGLDTITPGNIVVIIDLDRCNFKSERALNLALSRTLLTTKKALGQDITPSVLWSGNGYHIYVVLNANGIDLEHQDIITNLTSQPSRKFLQFVEAFLSGGHSDRNHNKTVSFKNCMLRIPGSINSKNNEAVRVVQKWDNYRPEINYLLSDFVIYLANQKAQELLAAKSKPVIATTTSTGNDSKIEWIESLLQTPLADHRKYCIWRILVPYLVNRRHMSEVESINIIKTWLASCEQLKRLDFNINQKINDCIRNVGDYKPAHPEKIREECPELYDLLQ